MQAVVRKRAVGCELWPVVRQWIDRVDNWCHSDGLSAIYSRLLETNGESEWRRRATLVSLIHYTGKNAIFLPVKKVLPLVSNCIDDHRYHVQMAVGWGPEFG